jgi:osmotically inducible protein OsmC
MFNPNMIRFIQNGRKTPCHNRGLTPGWHINYVFLSMKKFASVKWKGSGKDGKGHITTQSEELIDVPYSYPTRFGSERGTNPEELVAAAHAACFTMQLSFNLNKMGFVADEIDTQCEIIFDTDKSEITQSHLIVQAKVPSIEREKFNEAVEDARTNCPLSKLLKAKIIADANLV